MHSFLSGLLALWSVLGFLCHLSAAVEIVFKNNGEEEVILSWVLWQEHPREIARIAAKGKHSETMTNLEDNFTVLSAGEDSKNAKFVHVKATGGVVNINWPSVTEEWLPSRLTPEQMAQAGATCVAALQKARDELGDELAVEEDEHVFCRKFPQRGHVVETMKAEERLVDERGLAIQQRIVRTQPRAFRNFTYRGFRLLKKEKKWDGKMSEQFAIAHAEMTAWYEANRKEAQPEQGTPGVLSAYDNDNFVIRPPEDLISRLAKGVQKVLEKWAKLPDDSLEQTAVYGIRLYRRSARLQQHVDIWETHVLSAILSIGQRGIQSPWKLEILDHNGTMHNVADKAGDVILYESTTCAHGRSAPLQGREFANIFIHFRPKKGWGPVDPELVKHENRPGSLERFKAGLEL